MVDSGWFVYVLECLDGTYYTGITNDLDKRMLIHKSGRGSAYVRTRGFGRLLASKFCGSKSAALKIEYKVKQLPREEKLDYFK